jgi:iron complex transport system ATP-binding protein
MRLSASDLRIVRGGRTVLSGVSAAFEPGSITVVLGPNGAGKSSLLTVLAGLMAAEAGTVQLGDAALSGLPPRHRARAIGYLPQGAEVHWNLKVRDVVALGRQPHIGPFAGPSAADEVAIAAAMVAADLGELAARPILELSGGERARALLARVLAGEPPVLLADEPLANLDPRHQMQALALFRAEAARGRTVVLVLHDLHAAARCADRLLLLGNGRLLGAGSPHQVLTPALLRQAYGVDMLVRHDPELGLIVVPRE